MATLRQGKSLIADKSSSNSVLLALSQLVFPDRVVPAVRHALYALCTAVTQ